MTRALIGAMCWTTALIVLKLKNSGALPSSEFAPAGPLYTALPFVQALAALFFLWSGWRIPQRREQRTFRIFHHLALIALLAGLWLPWLLVIGCLLALVASVIAAASRMVAIVWPGTTKKDLGRSLLATLAVVLPAAWLLSSLEVHFYSKQFFHAGIVAEELYFPYLGALSGYSLFAGLKVFFAASRILLLMTILISCAKKFSGHKNTALAISACGLILSFNIFYLIWQSLEDEIIQLDILVESLALTFSSGLALTPAFLFALNPKATTQPISSPGSLLMQVLAPQRKNSKWLPYAPALCGLAICLPFLYPAIEDYRIKAFDSFAQLAVLSTALLFLVLLPRTRLARQIIVVALMILMGSLAYAKWAIRPELRLIAFEYSRFGSFGASAPWIRWMKQRDLLGMQDPGDRPTDPVRVEQLFPQKVLPQDERPPIFLVIWDAVRPDHCSLYGHLRATTPNLDRWAEGAMVFNRGYSTATATTLGVRNMMTGRYSTRYMLDDKHPPFFIANLAHAGYDSFYVSVTGNDYNGVSGESFKRSWNADRGGLDFQFKLYSNVDGLKPDRKKTSDLITHLKQKVQANGKQSIRGDFHYLHLTGAHSPWRNDDSIRDFGPSAIDKYDGEIAKLDDFFATFIEALENLDLANEAIIIVTADHGTGLGEHGRLGGFLPYDEQLRIPLIMKGSKIQAGRCQVVVNNVDIAPTLMSHIGSPMQATDGLDFSDYLTGGDIISRRKPWTAFCAFRDSYAVYDSGGRFKLHHHRQDGYEALFDLAKDPGEKQNLIHSHAAEAAVLRNHLDLFLWKGRLSYGNPFHYRAWDFNRER